MSPACLPACRLWVGFARSLQPQPQPQALGDQGLAAPLNPSQPARTRRRPFGDTQKVPLQPRPGWRRGRGGDEVTGMSWGPHSGTSPLAQGAGTAPACPRSLQGGRGDRWGCAGSWLCPGHAHGAEGPEKGGWVGGFRGPHPWLWGTRVGAQRLKGLVVPARQQARLSHSGTAAGRGLRQPLLTQ